MAVEPVTCAWLSRVRGRLALTGLLASVTVLTPTIAWATFTGKGSGAVSVGTATLAAPASVTLTVGCAGGGSGNGNGSARATFPEVALASSYQVVLDPPVGPNVTKVTTSGTTGATFSITSAGAYLIMVTSVRQGWTSAPITRGFTC